MTEVQNSVGTTFNDRTHFKQKQNGFKSLIAYRNDIGVPGYTGFLPGCKAIGVPIKDSVENQEKTKIYTLKNQQEATQDKVMDTIANNQIKSVYQKDFKAKPKQYRQYIQLRPQHLLPHKCLNGTTIYNAEIENSLKTQNEKLSQTLDSNCLTVDYVAGRKPCIERRKTLQDKFRQQSCSDPSKQIVGYTSQYSSMYVKDTKLNEEKFKVDNKNTKERPKVSERVMLPSLYDKTSYHRDYGIFYVNSLDKYKDVSKDNMTEKCSTIELDKGTCRTTKNPPGYTGFVPATDYKNLAKDHAYHEKPRKPIKNDMLLFHLGQYQQDLIAGFGGFRPQNQVSNKENFYSKPTKETTYGDATCTSAQYFYSPNFLERDNKNYIDSKNGIMTFFNQGAEFQSDNGIANAQRYYGMVRPFEGLENVKLHVPSRVNQYGSKFFN